MNLPRRHIIRFLLAVDAEVGVVRANVDLASFDDVAPVIHRMLDREELVLLCRIALFHFGKLFGFVGDRMKPNLTIWISKRLLKNCANAVCRRIEVDDEGMPHPGGRRTGSVVSTFLSC